jgi:flagellar biosynthesis/type III secretory pathway protein FliH
MMKNKVNLQDFNIEQEPLEQQRELHLQEQLMVRFQEGFAQGQLSGHAQGHEEGMNHALTSIESQILKCLEDIQQHFETTLEKTEGYFKKINETHFEIIEDVFSKCVPELYNHDLSRQVLELMKHSEAIFEKEPYIRLDLNASVLEDVQERLKPFPFYQKFKDKLHFQANELLDEQDCRLSWNYGGLERRKEVFMADLESILKAYQHSLENHKNKSESKNHG